jgi:hypothetical protein
MIANAKRANASDEYVARATRRRSYFGSHQNCIPEGMLDGTIKAYDDFLEARRLLMADKIKTWFQGL